MNFKFNIKVYNVILLKNNNMKHGIVLNYFEIALLLIDALIMELFHDNGVVSF